MDFIIIVFIIIVFHASVKSPSHGSPRCAREDFEERVLPKEEHYFLLI
jgi:hypothetical protein